MSRITLPGTAFIKRINPLTQTANQAIILLHFLARWNMIQSLIILVLGIGGSILALITVCTFLSQVSKDRFERSCQVQTYFNWVLQKGTEQQKRLAEELKKKNDLDALKALVGDSFLVDS